MRGGRKISLLLAALMTLASAAPVFASPTADSALGTVTDVIVGRNNKGPYTLSWTNIDVNSITAIVNGRTLRRGADFNIDSPKGMLAFNSNLLNDSIVRVTYRTVPGKSKKAAQAVNVPVTLDVFRSQDASLQVTGLRVQDNPNNSESGKTIVGVGGEKSWALTKISSQILMSQQDTSNAADQTKSWDRSAVKLGAESKFGSLGIKGSYTGVGENFSGQKEYGLQSGRKLMDLAVTFAEKDVAASASMNTTSDTQGKTAGATTSTQQQQVVYSPGDTKIAVTHVTTDTRAAASGASTAVETTAINVNQKLGQKTSATLKVEDKNTTSGASADSVQTKQATVSSSAIKNVTVQTSVTQTNSKTTGDRLATDTQLAIKPSDKIALQGSYTTANPSIGDDSSKAVVSVTAQPLRNTQLSGTMTTSVLGQNQQFQRNLNLSTTPLSFAKLCAIFTQTGINDNDDVTKGASIELTPLDRLRLGAGYRYIETGARVMTIMDYSASTNPWQFVKLTTAFRDRQVQAEDVPDTKSMQVDLSPMRYFVLTGTYQANPEDTRGQIQNYEATTAGLKLAIGSANMSAAFSSKDEYAADRNSQERQLGMELPFFRAGLLTTGYKEARTISGTEMVADTYSIGYRHSLGDSFSLSLTGNYTRYMQDRVVLPDRDEYSAEASLGVKF